MESKQYLDQANVNSSLFQTNWNLLIIIYVYGTGFRWRATIECNFNNIMIRLFFNFDVLNLIELIDLANIKVLFHTFDIKKVWM